MMIFANLAVVGVTFASVTMVLAAVGMLLREKRGEIIARTALMMGREAGPY